MKKLLRIIKKAISVTLLLTFIVIFFTFHTYRTLAASEPSWGGTSIFPWPCTCGENVPYVLWYTPLYLDSSVYLSGFMGTPYAVGYANYTLHAVQSALGTYEPGSAVCCFGECPYCIDIFNYGLVLPMTGTSP
jgi:hypothetical protein